MRSPAGNAGGPTVTDLRALSLLPGCQTTKAVEHYCFCLPISIARGAITRAVMENLRLVLAAVDPGFEHIVMARIYLTRFREDYPARNATYRSYCSGRAMSIPFNVFPYPMVGGSII